MAEGMDPQATPPTDPLTPLPGSDLPPASQVPSGPPPSQSKVSASDLSSLFLRPRAFFAERDLDVRGWYLTAAWFVGITTASGRIDQNLMRADLGQARPGWDAFSAALLESWVVYWLFVLGLGVLSAVVYWYLGGWWYRVRLRWAGDRDPDPRAARLVMVSSAFVMAAPTLAYMWLETATFPNYGAAWQSDSLIPVLLLVFPFWAVYVSYRGVRTRFAVIRWRAFVWFLALPAVVFSLAFGLMAVLYALLEPAMSSGGDRFA